MQLSDAPVDEDDVGGHEDAGEGHHSDAQISPTNFSRHRTLDKPSTG
jgi:hypothetical protein